MDIITPIMSDYYQNNDNDLNDLQLKKGAEFLIVNIVDSCFGIFQLVVLAYYFKSWMRLGKLKMMDVYTNLTFSFLTIAVLSRFFGSLLRCSVNFISTMKEDSSWLD